MEMQPDLLNDLNQEIYHEPASVGLRFGNYIIDIIMFYLLYDCCRIFYGELFSTAGGLMSYVIVYFIFISYYTVMEAATGGKTIGKLITGTTAIRNDGAPFTFNDAIIRSLCRIVPFEPLSAFTGNPWHDKWTNTKVIKVPR